MPAPPKKAVSDYGSVPGERAQTDWLRPHLSSQEGCEPFEGAVAALPAGALPKLADEARRTALPPLGLLQRDGEERVHRAAPAHRGEDGVRHGRVAVGALQHVQQRLRKLEGNKQFQASVRTAKGRRGRRRAKGRTACCDGPLPAKTAGAVAIPSMMAASRRPRWTAPSRPLASRAVTLACSPASGTAACTPADTAAIPTAVTATAQSNPWAPWMHRWPGQRSRSSSGCPNGMTRKVPVSVHEKDIRASGAAYPGRQGHVQPQRNGGHGEARDGGPGRRRLAAAAGEGAAHQHEGGLDVCGSGVGQQGVDAVADGGSSEWPKRRERGERGFACGRACGPVRIVQLGRTPSDLSFTHGFTG